MYRKGEDGQIYGVLNDLDLACFITSHKQPTSKHRTGTKPFMALDLLRGFQPDTPHYPRYDLESFIYVLGWVVGSYDNGKQVEHTPYSNWADQDWKTIEGVKRGWVFGSERVVTPTFALLQSALTKLCGYLRSGLLAQTDSYEAAANKKEDMKGRNGEPFCHRTLDGTFTYTGFLKELDEALAQLSQ